MDKPEEKTKGNGAPKSSCPKKRRGRPPKYPDVWGKPYPPPPTGTQSSARDTMNTTTPQDPVKPLASPVQHGQTPQQRTPPGSDIVDSTSFPNDKPDIQCLGSYSILSPDRSRKRQGRPRGSLNKKHSIDGCGYMGGIPAGSMVVTEEELRRMYYESGGRDVKNFPKWVQETYQGRALPVKIARLDSTDEGEAFAKPSIVFVEDKVKETCPIASPPIVLQPVNIPPSNMQSQPYHQPIHNPHFQTQQNFHNFPVRRNCDRTVSPVSPTVQLCGVVKPSCLVQNTDDALDLSTSGQKKSKNTKVTTQCRNVESWSVDEVCQFVSEVSNCEAYAQVFKEHVIDGQLLLELSENQMMNHLHMKLGPAMHLRRAIDKLKKNPE